MKTFLLNFLSIALILLSSASSFAQEALWKKLCSEFDLLYKKGNYSEAGKVAQEALKVAEKTFGPDHPNVGASLNYMR